MIACTRMYNVNAKVADLWRRLIERTSHRAKIPLTVIDHAPPARLDVLWSREDMGCVFMCGWPFRRAEPKPQIVAVPIPEGAGCQGPLYRTNLVVRTDSPFQRLEDTFGGRIAWTDENSHSGFNAPRRLLMEYADGRERLYRESVGPVITPRASLLSVLEGRVDVAPLDSYFHALLRRHEPKLASQVRVVAHTDCAPIPPLVAAANAPLEMVAALGSTFETADKDVESHPLLEALCLSGFAPAPDPERYALMEKWDREAVLAGYPSPD